MALVDMLKAMGDVSRKTLREGYSTNLLDQHT